MDLTQARIPPLAPAKCTGSRFIGLIAGAGCGRVLQAPGSAVPLEAAVGNLQGLYRCRDRGPESLLKYNPDNVTERASDVVARCGKLGVRLPVTDLVDLTPAWSALPRHAAVVSKGRERPAVSSLDQDQ